MNYNREFLVPYLQNICALELLNMEISESIVRLKNDSRHIAIKHENSVKIPIPPEDKTNYGILYPSVFVVLGSIFPFITLGLIFDMELFLWFGFTFLFIGGIGCMIEWPNNEEYKRKKRLYDIEYENYKKELAVAKKRGESAAMVNSPKLVKLQNERDKVRELLNQAYSANIIPSKYRGIYPAVYLYDYFQSSQSTDIEKALTLYVLEEIKSELNEIIENQSEIIINQRIGLAYQKKTYEQQKNYEMMMREKLDDIIASNEERNAYMQMISADSKITSYLITSEYLK